MRIVVHGDSLGGTAVRLAAAAAGLAARGHDVVWRGRHAPALEGVRAVRDDRELDGLHADIVLGGGEPARVGWLAWRLHAPAVVLAVTAADLGRWRGLDRLAWDALPAFGLLAEGESEAARTTLRATELARIVLWPADPDGGQGAPGAPEHPDTELLERACERLLAQRARRVAGGAVFLDRDGTLVEEHGYVADPERIVLLPGVAAALRHLHDAGLRLVVVSNQSGIGRGLYTERAAHATMARLRRLLRAGGVELDAVRFCPHAPEAGCACRKPGTALFEAAAEDLRITLATSVMVGDKRLDAAAGQAAGGLGVLVRTGYGRDEEGRIADGSYPPPDRVFDDLGAAAAWILGRVEGL